MELLGNLNRQSESQMKELEMRIGHENEARHS